MPTDALVTWGTKASAGMVLISKARIQNPASEELKPMIKKSLKITSMISVAKLLWVYQNTWHKPPKKVIINYLNDTILASFNFLFISE